ncbi:MAG: CRISPR-associated endonuclease Cas1, partial [Cytophagales bacterium]|nr:CRISPR-associated endonuclease Cas1 [Cytophagales bacterium]
MLGQIVEVASNGVHLSTERGFLKLSRDGERLGEVPLDDVGAVVVHGHGATFSANLCERLAARNAPFVICGSNHAPAAML